MLNFYKNLKISHLIALFFFIFYFIINAGFATNGDVKIVYLNAKNLVDNHSLSFSKMTPNLTAQTIELPNGRVIAKPSILLTLSFVPFLFLSKLIHALSGLPVNFTDEFLISLLNVLAGTFSVVIFFKILAFFGLNNKTSIIGTLIFGLLSSVAIYAKSTPFESAYILFLLLITYNLLKYRDSQNLKYIYLASVIFSLMFVLKSSNLIFAPVMFLGFLLFTSGDLKFFTLVKIAIPLIIAFIITFTINYLFMGSPFKSTYGDEIFWFTTPILEGLKGQLFSLQYGILIYSPLSLLCFLSFIFFFKSHRKEAIFLGTLFMVNLLFHSMWHTPQGGEGVWGPRFLAMTEFVLFISLSLFIHKFQKNEVYKTTLAVFIFMALVTQTLSISIYSRQHNNIEDEIIYSGFIQKDVVPQFYGHALLFANKITGGAEVYDLTKFLRKPQENQKLKSYDMTPYKTFKSFDFWFIHAAASLHRPLITKLLFLFISILVIIEILISKKIFKNIFLENGNILD